MLLSFSFRSERRQREDVDPTQPSLSGKSEATEQGKVKKYMRASIAHSTAQGYEQLYRKWEEYCEQRQVSCVPATVERASGFIALLADETGSWAQVKKGAAAIAKAHDEAFVQRPTDNASFKRLMRGIQRELDKPHTRTRRVPLTKDILHRAIAKFLQPAASGAPASLTNWRTVWRMTMEFYAVARWDDISQVDARDITFLSSSQGDYMRIFFCKSKTDQRGEGATAVVKAQSNSQFCPVVMTKNYMQLLGYQQSESRSQPMQPRVRMVRGRQVAQVQKVSYTTSLQDLRRILTGIGEVAIKFGEHSGRRGGATAAAAGGASVASIQTGGRWASERSAAIYIDRSEEDKIQFAGYLEKQRLSQL